MWFAFSIAASLACFCTGASDDGGSDSRIYLPTNPCPELFQYRKRPNGLYFGEIKFPNDGTGNFVLEVNVSVAGRLDNQNIKLELITPYEDLYAGRSAVYHVHFPTQRALPEVKLVLFNGRPGCIGAPDYVVPAQGLTMMWAKSILRLNSPVSIPINNNNNNNNNNLIFKPPNNDNVNNLILKPPPNTAVNEDRFPVGRGSCGRANDARSLVVNGVKTSAHEFPWLVAIMYKRNNFQYKFKCTGNLIDNVHVLTAAHCLQFYKAPLIPKEDLLVVLGKHNLDKWANGGAVLRDVKTIDVHPSYKQNSGEGDLAVITLNSPVTFTNKLSPVCLWDEDAILEPLVRTSGIVAGWGKDENGDDIALEPRKLSMPIVSQETCLRSHPVYFDLTSENTFCAGGLNGRGPCTGDSGAGFILNRNGRWSIRGVVSLAIKDLVGSCDTTKYFVFSDVAKLKNWVKQVLSRSNR